MILHKQVTITGLLLFVAITAVAGVVWSSTTNRASASGNSKLTTSAQPLSPSQSSPAQNPGSAALTGGVNAVSPLGQTAIFGAPLLTKVTARTPDLRGAVEVFLLATSDEPDAPRIVFVSTWTRREAGAIQTSQEAVLVSASDASTWNATIGGEAHTDSHLYTTTVIATKPWLEVSEIGDISVAFTEKPAKTTK